MLDINNTETLEIYVLGDDFKFYQNLKYLPLTSYPSNIQSALIVYSLRGKAKLTVHEDVHWIQPKELIILLPGQFVSFSDPSEDFLTVTECARRIKFIAISCIYEAIPPPRKVGGYSRQTKTICILS